jgi:vitellogenic carboxypeptidase-like protein
MLWKHGPLAVEKKKIGDSYVLRNHTWVGPFSVVYVDNPVGVGYSYSEMGEDGYRLTQEGYTQDLYNFVLQFFKLFPEYKNREFYIGGQSYAGKYVTALAHRIHEQRHNECREVPLTGIILGGPYFDPPTESVAFFDYLYAVGAISYADKDNYKAKERSVYQEFLQRGLLNATTNNIFNKILYRDDIGVESLDNYVTGESPNYLKVALVMASAKFRKAIHVDQKRKFFALNEEVHSALVMDFLVSTKPQMTVLMDNYKVLVYNGDYDVVVSSVMIEAALMTTNWTMQGQYNNSHR